MLEHLLRQIELLILGLFFVGVFCFVYLYFCNNGCRNIIFFGLNLLELLKIGFPIAAIVNSLRIALVFRLHDNDDEPEYLFYASLCCLALSYIFFGLFLDDFIANSQKSLTNSWGFIITLITFFVAVGSLLADRQSWDKSTNFVKARVVLSLLNFTLLLINPTIGILSTIFFAPVALLWPSTKPNIHLDN